MLSVYLSLCSLYFLLFFHDSFLFFPRVCVCVLRGSHSHARVVETLNETIRLAKGSTPHPSVPLPTNGPYKHAHSSELDRV